MVLGGGLVKQLHVCLTYMQSMPVQATAYAATATKEKWGVEGKLSKLRDESPPRLQTISEVKTNYGALEEPPYTGTLQEHDSKNWCRRAVHIPLFLYKWSKR